MSSRLAVSTLCLSCCLIATAFAFQPTQGPHRPPLTSELSSSVDYSNYLSIGLPGGDQPQHAPPAWQRITGIFRPLDVNLVALGESEPSFLDFGRDPGTPATSDPSLSWQTFLGSAGRDHAFGVAADGSGSVYVVGRSKKNWGVPVRRYNGGKGDAFVAKLGTSGELLWNTFLGSTSDDLAVGIAVGPSGIYVSGASARSWGTPIRPFSGRYDAFVASLGFDGVLRWNTFLGSSGMDGGAGIGCDSAGNVYVAGGSSFSWGTPVREFGWGGVSDAFVAKLSANGSLLWNTFLGSRDHDVGLGLVPDGAGNVLVAGSSKASWGTPLNAYSGGSDAFVARLSGTSGALVWNTFLGSTDQDDAAGIASDSTGNLLVVGRSKATWGSPVRAHSGTMNSFAAKLDASGRLAWNTFLGSSSERYSDGRPTSPFTRSSDGDGAVGVVVDAQGNVLVAGTSTDTWGSPVIPREERGGSGYVAKLDPSGLLRWNTFMGMRCSDPNGYSCGYSTAMGIATDRRGRVYVAGMAYYYERRTLWQDSFVAKFLDGSSAAPRPTPRGASRRVPGSEGTRSTGVPAVRFEGLR